MYVQILLYPSNKGITMEIVATCVFLISPTLNRTGSMVYAGRIHNTQCVQLPLSLREM